MIESVTESFEDLRGVVTEGVNLNDNTKRKIESILKLGTLEFFTVSQLGILEFR